MPRLVVQLLGGVRVALDGAPLTLPTRWSAGLLASLALQRGRMLHRDVLAARFWPDETDQRARKALRNALWGVRQAIEPDAVPRGSFLKIEGPLVGMADGSDVWVDVLEFERLLSWSVDAIYPEVGVAPLVSALDLYYGDLIEGYDFDWCVPDRERLRLAHLAAMERLMEIRMGSGDWERAIPLGQAILRCDPLREQIHRRLMLCHVSQGNRPLAIRQFRSCQGILQDELGIAPMAATEQLFRDIQADAFDLGVHEVTFDDGPTEDPARVADLAVLREARLVSRRLLSQITPT